jgi:hypothetical protein
MSQNTRRCPTTVNVVIDKGCHAIIKTLATHMKEECAGAFIIARCDGHAKDVVLKSDMQWNAVNNNFAFEVVFHTHGHINSPSAQDMWVAFVRCRMYGAPSLSFVYDKSGMYAIFVNDRGNQHAIRSWLNRRGEEWVSGKRRKPQGAAFVRHVNGALGKLGLRVGYTKWANIMRKQTWVSKDRVHLFDGFDGKGSHISRTDIPRGVPLALDGVRSIS